MVTFTDRYGRAIDIVVDDVSANADAYFNGKRIGYVETTGWREMDKSEDLPPKLTGMFVDTEYQAAGIGLALLDKLSDVVGVLEPADRNIGKGGRNALTGHGLALTQRAQAAGYVLPFDDDRHQ